MGKKKEKVVHIGEPSEKDKTDRRIIISENADGDFHGDMVILNPDSIREYYEESVYAQLIDILDRYCEETGTKLDISWENVKETLKLKRSEEKDKFNELLDLLLKDAEQKAHEEEKKATERPTKYSQAVTKLTENLPQLDFTGDTTEQDFIVSPKKSKKISLVTLVTDNTSLSDGSVTAFDNTVFNAVISFIEAGEQSFTLEQITNFIYYGDNTANRASAKQRKEVRASILKQMSFLIKVDYTQHLALNGIPLKDLTNEKGKVTDQRLTLKEFEVGNKVGYCLKDNNLPPEYVYAKDVKQIATVDARLLDTPQNLHLKSKDVVWRDYLMREIDTMSKNKTLYKASATVKAEYLKSHINKDKPDKKRDVRVMKVDTILLNCNIVFTTKKPRDERSDLLGRIMKLLEYYVSIGFISGCDIQRGKKNSIERYIIEM